MKQNTFLYLFLVVFGVFNTPPPLFAQKNNKVIVTGKILHPDGFLANIKFFEDALSKEELFYGGILEENNTFKVEFEIDQPTVARLEHGGNQALIYLEPGDKIDIYFDNWDFDETLYFQGVSKASNANNYLKKVRKRDDSYFSDAVLAQKYQYESEESFMEYLKNVHRDLHKFFKDYQKEAPFSPNFSNYALCHLEYKLMNCMMSYPKFHQNYAAAMGYATPVIQPTYYRFLKKSNFTTLKDINSAEYRLFLLFYTDYLVEQNTTMQPNLLRYYEHKNRVGIIKDHFSGADRDFLLAHTFKNAAEEGKLFELAKEVELFLRSEALQSYKNTIFDLYQIASTLRPGVQAPVFQLEDVDGNLVSSTDLKGKVLYIDFWATWCGPCRDEIEAARTLKKQFPNDDVLFIYITMDKDKEVWRKFVKENNLQGLHLFAGGGFETSIGKKYNVNGVPTYYLINRDGLIASSSPKRPSQPGAAEELQAVLDFSTAEK